MNSTSSNPIAASPPPIASRRLIGWLATICVLACLLSIWLLTVWPLSISLDTAMYLSGAMTLLDGGTMYIDFIDLNPPLAVELHKPAVLLGRLLHIPPISAFYCLMFAATLASALATYRLLAGPDTESRVNALIMSLPPIGLLLTLSILLSMGQRPHLFVLTLLPYLLVRLRRVQGQPAGNLGAAISGLLLGVAACLKPLHYGGLLLAIELYLLVRHRKFRSLVAPEIIAAALVTITYAGYLLTMPAASSEAFFDYLLPMIVNSYDVYGRELSDLMFWFSLDIGGPLLFSVALFIVTRSLQDERYRELANMVAVSALASAVMYSLQGKGWPYHAIPLMFSSYVLLAIACTHPVIRVSKLRFAAALTAAPVLVLCTALALSATQASMRAVKHAFWTLQKDAAELILNETETDDTVLIVSTSVDYSYPLLLLVERRPASRYAFMFPIPLLYDGAQQDPDTPYMYKIAAENELAEQRFLAELNSDIEANQPQLILIEHYITCFACPEQMNLPTYLALHRDALPALSRYESSGRTERMSALRLKAGE